MEQFPCESESLGVRLGLVPGGIVWENMENTDQNKAYFEAHVWDGAWQKITSPTSAWNSATLWPSEIYTVLGSNIFGSLRHLHKGHFQFWQEQIPTIYPLIVFILLV